MIYSDELLALAKRILWLGTSEEARRWVSRRLLNYIRVGNQFRFRAATVELFLAQREVRK